MAGDINTLVAEARLVEANALKAFFAADFFHSKFIAVGVVTTLAQEFSPGSFSTAQSNHPILEKTVHESPVLSIALQSGIAKLRHLQTWLTKFGK